MGYCPTPLTEVIEMTRRVTGIESRILKSGQCEYCRGTAIDRRGECAGCGAPRSSRKLSNSDMDVLALEIAPPRIIKQDMRTLEETIKEIANHAYPSAEEKMAILEALRNPPAIMPAGPLVSGGWRW